MKRILRSLLTVLACVLSLSAAAQQYMGMSGLIHVPTGAMNEAGEARIGGHFLNREMTPDMMRLDGSKYHTWTHYLSATPFSWLELAYSVTLMKVHKPDADNPDKVGYYYKDRALSVKVQPLREREGRWWPSIAVGGVDLIDSKESDDNPAQGSKSQYFANYYVAASKHIDLRGHRLGVHVAYRHWKLEGNERWNGPVGGITFQPAFQRNLRFMAEYTGDDVNVGFDWKLWKHLLVQSSLQNGKYFSGGLCFCVNLLNH